MLTLSPLHPRMFITDSSVPTPAQIFERQITYEKFIGVVFPLNKRMKKSIKNSRPLGTLGQRSPLNIVEDIHRDGNLVNRATLWSDGYYTLRVFNNTDPLCITAI